MIIIHLLADLVCHFVKNYLRKLVHNDNLIITAYHVAESFGQAICSNFQTPLTDSFLNGLMENKNGNLLAKVLMKYNESKQNIRVNYKTRPGRGQNKAKVDSIKDTANTLKQSLTENLVSHVKKQSQNGTLVEYESLLHMERMINIDEQILQLKKLHTLYGTNYVHRVPEERDGWDKFKLFLAT